MNRKAELENVPQYLVILGVIAIVIGLSQVILQNFRVMQCNSNPGTAWNTTINACSNAQTGAVANNVGYAYNSTTQGAISLATFSQFQPTIAIVITASIILTIIGAFLMKKVV